MKNILLLLFFPVLLQAQIEKVVVETYYVSDANDASDTTGGTLEAGSKTYRIYIDLEPGCKLKKIYGDANHALKFSSTNVFFNNKADGQSFAKDFSKNRYKDNTVALDTWLTLGQTTKTSASAANFGVLKKDDVNGSFVGGANNDGGSSAIDSGLLRNNDSSAGVPLDIADGMDTLQTLPSNWGDYGIKDLISGDDSTIFGSINSDSQFVSYNAGLQNSGVMGVLPDSNYVLVAQLTTKGEISFEINVEVIDTTGNSVKYVANGDTLLANEVVNPNLKYPLPCGCTDPDYLEYSSNFACLKMDSCRTLAVLGCTDPFACNYNPLANFPVPSLCCYPGACNGLDISLVCPSLAVNDLKEELNLSIYPNPVLETLNIRFSQLKEYSISYSVTDVLGREISSGKIPSGSTNLSIETKTLPQGFYLLYLFRSQISAVKAFVKQ